MEPAPNSPGDEFEPTAEMMVNDFDDERTLDEEEALEEAEDQSNELSNLEKEKDMPIEALLAMYGYNEDGEDEDDEQQEEDEANQEDEDVKKDEVASDLLNEEEEEEAPETVNNNEEMTGSDSRPPQSSDEPPEEIEMECEEAPERSMLQELYKDDPAVCTGGSRNLRSGGSRQQSEEEEDEEEEDGDYSPEEEDWKKTIMVGSDYQAEVPSGLCKYDDAMPYENEDKLLWDPATCTEQQVTEYLSEVQDIQQAQVTQGVELIPRGSHVRDDEQALYLLLQCGHNKDEAIRRQKINFVSPDSMSLWSEEECRNFETGLRQYGKDFHSIQQNRQVRTRSVSELVQFYYLWKKTERHDIFANKARLEKKKYTLHPGTTDFMERFLDEQDSPVSSPSVHSLLSGDPKRQTRTPPPNNSFNDTTELITEDEAKLITSHYEEIARHLDEKSLESLVKLVKPTNGLSSSTTSSAAGFISPSETFTNAQSFAQ